MGIPIALAWRGARSIHGMWNNNESDELTLKVMRETTSMPTVKAQCRANVLSLPPENRATTRISLLDVRHTFLNLEYYLMER